jgi:hypothetical protein
VTIIRHKPLICFGFLDRIQILALDILDERDLERLDIIEFANDDRDLVKLRPLRRPPAPLAGDDLIAACGRTMIG